MVSIRLMPSEVVPAQAEYSVCPTQYRLSNTFTGSAYHCERGGTCLGVPPGAFGAAGRNDVGEQTASNRPRCSWPAAALAAATCESTVSAPCRPRTVAMKDTKKQPPPSRVVARRFMARPPTEATKKTTHTIATKNTKVTKKFNHEAHEDHSAAKPQPTPRRDFRG